MKRAGFSLIEVLLVVSLLATLASIGIAVAGSIRERTMKQKLSSDVATLNRAVKIYVSSGGTLAGITDPVEILENLKTEVEENLVKRIPGLSGSMIDSRIQISPDPPRKGAEFAVWNLDELRFEISADPDASTSTRISRFVLGDESVRASTGSLNTPTQYSAVGNWIWEYEESSAPAPAGPSVFVTAEPPNSSPPPVPGVPPPPPPPRILKVPEFSIPGGEYPATEFPLSLILTDPNPSRVSELVFWINGGSQSTYAGQILRISPDDVVTAYARSKFPEEWLDSSAIRNTYRAETIPPQTLEAPTFSIPGGDYPATSFPMSLTLGNPNSGDISEIVFWVNSGPRSLYSGEVIRLSSGDVVTAYASSKLPELWLDSATRQNSYQAIAGPLLLDFSMSVRVAND